MREWFPMAVHLLEGLFLGHAQHQQSIVGQRERLLALGSLSAGLTHELNNPAAAAVRATASLRDRVAGMRHKLAHDRRRARSTASALQTLIELQEAAVERVAKAPELSPDGGADREDELGDWLEDHGIDGRLGARADLRRRPASTSDWLDQVARRVAPSTLERRAALAGLHVETELLMNEIDGLDHPDLHPGRRRQAVLADGPGAVPGVDVHELLDSTLVMLGAQDRRRASRWSRTTTGRCRTIPAYAAELNQVWTNLIDNAVAGDGRRAAR